MFTRYTTDFADITTPDGLRGAMLSLSEGTLVESQRGWRAVEDLRPSDRIASLDGGFVPLAWVRRAVQQAAFFVPAGALGNCSDLSLPAEARIGLTAPGSFTDATTDTLSVPLRALAGLRGIRKHGLSAPRAYTIGLTSEEMLWVQTGLLVHAKPMTEPYFHALGPSETRALFGTASGLARAVAA